MNDKKLQFLRDRALRALGNNSVEKAVAKTRAIIGVTDIPASEVDAQKALEKLYNNEVPEPAELAALELVIRLLRPAPLSRNKGQLDDLPDQQGRNLYPQELKDLWSDFRKKSPQVLSAVGRVEMANGQHIGTGFLVGPEALMTNRHVLGDLSFGTELLGPGQARVGFRREIGGGDAKTDFVSIEGVTSIHPKLDMVVLKIKAQPDRGNLTIALAAAGEGEQVATIGYPAADEGRNPLFSSAVFGTDYGYKRAALGEVLDGTGNPTLFHDCSTLGGNSGSPVISLKTGLVVGIHYSGYFMYRNEAVDADELRSFAPAPAAA